MNVLVVELDGKPALEHLLPGVQVQHISASAALADYLDAHGLSRVTRRLVDSGVIEVVATASPGIDDIVVLGKVKQLERSGAWDLVLVDGPAAGHAVTFLMAASALAATVPGGPVHTQATEVGAMLTDPSRCQVVLVTLPETTPANEAIETAHLLQQRVGVRLGPVVVNAVDDGPLLPADAAPDGSPMRAAADFRNARRSLHATECARLHAELPLSQLHLPLEPGSVVDAEAVDRLADAWVAR